TAVATPTLAAAMGRRRMRRATRRRRGTLTPVVSPLSSPRTLAASAVSSPAVWKRSSGFFAMARASTASISSGRSGRSAVSGGGGAGHLPQDADAPGGLEPALCRDEGAEVGSLDVAHGQEEAAVRLPRLVDGNDVGVVEARRQAGLPDEPFPEPGVPGELGRE